MRTQTHDWADEAAEHLMNFALDGLQENIALTLRDIRAQFEVGLHVSAQPAAQQPSDLVKRGWAQVIADVGSNTPQTLLLRELLDRIEALEAAAAQPSEREAALVLAARDVINGRSTIGARFEIPVTTTKFRALLKATRAYDTPVKPDAGREEEG